MPDQKSFFYSTKHVVINGFCFFVRAIRSPAQRVYYYSTTTRRPVRLRAYEPSSSSSPPPPPKRLLYPSADRLCGGDGDDDVRRVRPRRVRVRARDVLPKNKTKQTVKHRSSTPARIVVAGTMTVRVFRARLIIYYNARTREENNKSGGAHTFTFHLWTRVPVRNGIIRDNFFYFPLVHPYHTNGRRTAFCPPNANAARGPAESPSSPDAA